MVVRVCVVGAGPSGMGLLAMFNKLQHLGEEVEVTCYERQDKTGGLWNLTWRTGLDEHGEPVHCSQYRDLFSNGPKECLELPDYTFADHFGKNIPSFPPREVLEDYLRGYWKHHGVKEEDVQTGHCVRSVKYDEDTATFTVKVINFKTRQTFEKEFDRLVVATGHFSVPNVPDFPGIDKFNGRVLHAHDFRNAREFTGQRLLCIGSSYSAEDIALQCWKFGAAHITISYRTKAMDFHWPEQIKEVPLLVKIANKTCFFSDGSSGEFDAIILCTGYQTHFPFMPSHLELSCGNVLFPPNLYRSIQWYGTEEGATDVGGRLFYLGMEDQFYTFTMFIAQALWTAHVVKGLHTPPGVEQCKQEIAECMASEAGPTDCSKQIDLQTAYIKRLTDDIGYFVDLDASEMFKTWEQYKHDDILSYRDKSFVSKYSGDVAPVNGVLWRECWDDSLEGYTNPTHSKCGDDSVQGHINSPDYQVAN